MEYWRPEHPPPFTASRRPASGVWRCSSSSFSRATALSATTMPLGAALATGAGPGTGLCVVCWVAWSLMVSPPGVVKFAVPTPLGCLGLARGALLLEVLDGRLDGVLGEDRAVDLHRRQRQLPGHVLVGDGHRLVHRLALHPLGDERRGGDGGPAAERLDARVL